MHTPSSYAEHVFHRGLKVLWNHLGGAELGEEDGGEPEEAEAGTERRRHGNHDGDQRGADGRWQNPPAADAGCAVPGRAGRGRAHNTVDDYGLELQLYLKCLFKDAEDRAPLKKRSYKAVNV